MKNLVNELKKLVPLKATTTEGDVVLVAAKEPSMLFYGYVTKIEKDNTRKDEWWHIHFSVLSVPMQPMTWTLRTEQMTGQEIFTMGGEERFFQAVDIQIEKDDKPEEIKQKSIPEKKGATLKRIK